MGFFVIEGVWKFCHDQETNLRGIGPMRERHESGAEDFIAKPYEIKQLLQMIRER